LTTTLTDSAKELHDYVARIAEDIEAIYEGESDEYEDLYEWLGDQLEAECFESDKGNRFVEILITYGGPTVRLTTRTEETHRALGSGCRSRAHR